MSLESTAQPGWVGELSREQALAEALAHGEHRRCPTERWPLELYSILAVRPSVRLSVCLSVRHCLLAALPASGRTDCLA